MTTTSTATPTISSDISVLEKKVGVWLDPVHLVLVGLLVGALLIGVYLFEAKRAEVAEAKSEIAAEVLKKAQADAVVSAQANVVLQEQAKETEAALAAANTQLAAANQQLQAANQQLLNKLLAQQKTDAQLPPSGQAQRWQQLVPSATVTATPTGFTVDPVGGLATVQALEEIPTDRQELANLNNIITDDEKTILNDEKALDTEKVAHISDLDNDKKQLIASQDGTKKVQADFNAYKKKARKNYLKAFGLGFLAGVFGGHAAGF